MGIPSNFETISEFRMEPLNSNRLIAFYDRMGFRDLKRRVRGRLESVKGKKLKPKASSRLGEVYDAMLDGKDVEYISQKQPVLAPVPSPPPPPRAAEPKAIIENDIHSLGDNSNQIGKQTEENQSALGLDPLKTYDQFQNRTEYQIPPDEREFDDVPF